MKLKIKKLYPDAQLPTYGSNGAACFDLYAYMGAEDPVTLEAGMTANFETGRAFEIPEGYAMLIFSRSGHGFKNGVRLCNCVGVIDSDYRGQVQVKLVNDGNIPFTVYNGDRIAQAMLIPVPAVQFEEVAELTTTVRGEGGFGSTDKQGSLF